MINIITILLAMISVAHKKVRVVERYRIKGKYEELKPTIGFGKEGTATHPDPYSKGPLTFE